MDMDGQVTRTSRKRRRRRAIWYPVRLIGVGAAGVTGAFLLFQLYVKINHPYQLGDEEARKVVALQERLNRQDRQNAVLDQQLQYLQSNEGTETLARRAGYHKPGETVYLLDRDAISATQSPQNSVDTTSP
jgi:cell division protein FtsB